MLCRSLSSICRSFTTPTLLVGLIVLIEFIKLAMAKEFVHIAKVVGCLAAATILAFGVNSMRLWTVQEYSKESTRGGKSEMTIGQEKDEKGAGREYAYGWSYGRNETMTLIVPGFLRWRIQLRLFQNRIVQRFSGSVEKCLSRSCSGGVRKGSESASRITDVLGAYQSAWYEAESGERQDRSIWQHYFGCSFSLPCFQEDGIPLRSSFLLLPRSNSHALLGKILAFLK